MNQTDMEKNLQADPELDAMLEQMSGEVPPMPADFHDKWMNAIRAEAAQNASAPEEKTEKKVVSLTRWTRILSIAAVFIFLIGGTALYRNSRGSLMPAADKTEAAVMADLASAAREESAEETEEEPDIREKNADKFRQLRDPYIKAMVDSFPPHMRKASEFEAQYIMYSDGRFIHSCLRNLLDSGRLKLPEEAQKKSMSTLLMPV